LASVRIPVPTTPLQQPEQHLLRLFAPVTPYLVGFTASSEAQDPEDVRARLRPYHARLRSEIAAYRGEVGKFVDDAVREIDCW
jgi:hypothetical protein